MCWIKSSRKWSFLYFIRTFYSYHVAHYPTTVSSNKVFVTPGNILHQMIESLWFLWISISILSWSCIGFLGNRSGGPRTGHRARSQVAYRGALYRELLLNTDTKLNKQSRTMFQGWSQRNNPQAKVLTTVPRAAWHQGVVSHTVSLGNQATS